MLQFEFIKVYGGIRMKRELRLVILISLAISLVGCNKDNNEVKVPNVLVDQEENQETSDEIHSILKDFVELIGLNDKEVVSIMGEGIKPVNNEMELMTTREYVFKLQNNDLTAIVSYNDKGVVQGVYSYLPDYDTGKWENLLTSELGTPTRVDESNISTEDGNDILNVLWLVEGKLITLFGSYGTLSIQME
jgi:hypothetical protein